MAGRFTAETTFPDNDVRSRYYAGDRLARTVRRVEEIKKELEPFGAKLPEVAIQFALAHEAVSTVIVGTTSPKHAEQNSGISDMPPLPEELSIKLRSHAWRRSFWYGGK